MRLFLLPSPQVEIPRGGGGILRASQLNPFMFFAMMVGPAMVSVLPLEWTLPSQSKSFFRLAFHDKILSQENLDRRRCNIISTRTCVLCNTNVEGRTHLLLSCRFFERIWAHFAALFLSLIPISLSEAWTVWG